jgi:hypothetical protein
MILLFDCRVSYSNYENINYRFISTISIYLVSELFYTTKSIISQSVKYTSFFYLTNSFGKRL